MPGVRTTCPRTGKARFRDRGAAQEALNGIDYSNPNRREQRAYKCPLCRGWHLTSQVQRTAGRRRKAA